MISVREAQDIVLKQACLSAVELVDLPQAQARVLREVLVCDRNQPAFNKSTMDGITVPSQVFNSGIRSFKIIATIPAGKPAPKLKLKDGCFKIMTGAVVPDGQDAVIPIEYVRIKDSIAEVTGLPSVKSGWNIRLKGQDCSKGAVLLKAGCSILPSHIATAASIGKSKIKVSRKPKVAIISTGDELVDIHIKNIKPYQTRLSNSYAVGSAVESQNLGETSIFHLKDDPKQLLREIRGILKRFDVLVLSGGVSMGDFDYVPQVLDKLKVKQLFHKVAQKPGKPFWFGTTAGRKAVFALPGNPVSTLVCAYRYLLPFLRKSAGLPIEIGKVIVDHDVSVKTDLTAFLPVEFVSAGDAAPRVATVDTGGSGDGVSLSRSKGFIEVPAGIKQVPRNTLLDFYPW